MKRVFLALVFASSGAAAAGPTKDACINANSSAQASTLDGHFAAARTALGVCSAQACPRLVRTDCVRQLAALDERQPSILLEVRDSVGGDLANVTVSLDGKPWLTKVAGLAVEIDPGPHTLLFEAPNHEPHTESVVAREGEKSRPVSVFLAPLASKVSAPAASDSASVTPRTAGVFAAGAGVVGLVLGGAFGGLAFSEWSSATSACSGNPGHCTGSVLAANGHRDDAETAATVSTVAFTLGGVALATGAVLYFVVRRPADEHPHALGGLTIAPAAAPNGGHVMLSGRF